MHDKTPSDAARQESAAQSLRRQAEHLVQEREELLPAPSPEEARQSLHELRVYQVELEMQNEELRRTQVELDTAQERYFDFYDLAPVGYCTLSKAGLIVEANLTAASLLGVVRSALLMQSLSRFIHKEDQDKYYLLRKQLLVVGDVQVCELRVQKHNGMLFWGHLVTTCSRDSEGLPLQRVVLSDISERVLLQHQSAHTQKMQAIGQFTGGIAHDFNNILASIAGYTELALERATATKDDKLADYLYAVKRSSARAIDLISKLLVFSRGGKSKSSVQNVAVAPLLAEIIKLLRPLLPSTLELVLRVEPGAPNLSIDPSHLYQMIMNLCINARDALAESGRIEVGLTNRVTVNSVCSSCHQTISGEFVEIWARDQGCGITPETLVNIFEPFYSTKALGKGTGLGLSTVHGLMHGYDGHIVVASTLGVGTTVRLLLPAAMVSVAPALPVAPLPAAPAVAGSGEMILVVDDELPITFLLSEVFQGHGYQVKTFNSSQAALEEFRAQPARYAALVTDYAMPGMNGIQLTHEILALRADLPVILCSGYAEQINVAAVESMGVRRFFAKPVKNQVLLDALAELLRAK